MMQKFELELKMTESGIVSNAEALKTELTERLKPYNYVVTEETYADAKTDRTKLNNLEKVISTRRKDFEKRELASWNETKALIMDLEKQIKAASDNLGNGIKTIDEEAKSKKMEDVRNMYMQMLPELAIKYSFDQLYIRKDYDKNTMSAEKIFEDIKSKIERLNTSWELVQAYLPTDEVGRQQCVQLYADTLDVGQVKMLADKITNIQQKVVSSALEQQNKKPKEEHVESVNNAQNEQKVPNTTDKALQCITFTVEAERSFFDALNVFVSQHKTELRKLQILERKDI